MIWGAVKYNGSFVYPHGQLVAAVVTIQQSGEMTAALWGLAVSRRHPAIICVLDGRTPAMSTTLLQQGNFPSAAATSSRFAHSHKILRILSNPLICFWDPAGLCPRQLAYATSKQQIRRDARERALFTSTCTCMTDL